MQELMTIALPEPPSDDNAERANHWFGLVQEHGRATLEAAANLGEVLIEQRDLCMQETKRGGSSFSQWCEYNLPFSRQQANKYIAISENWELVTTVTSSDEPLSIRGALRLIEESKPAVEKINRADIPKTNSKAQGTIEVEACRDDDGADGGLVHPSHPMATQGEADEIILSREEERAVGNAVAAAVGLTPDELSMAKAVVLAAEEDPLSFGLIKDEMNETGNIKTAYCKLRDAPNRAVYQISVGKDMRVGTMIADLDCEREAVSRILRHIRHNHRDIFDEVAKANP